MLPYFLHPIIIWFSSVYCSHNISFHLSFAHFCSFCSYLFISQSCVHLDPPTMKFGDLKIPMGDLSLWWWVIFVLVRFWFGIKGSTGWIWIVAMEFFLIGLAGSVFYKFRTLVKISFMHHTHLDAITLRLFSFSKAYSFWLFCTLNLIGANFLVRCWMELLWGCFLFQKTYLCSGKMLVIFLV